MTGLQVLRVPGWGLSYVSAPYCKRRPALHIGPFLVFSGQIVETEKTCCELYGVNCQQGRDCPARKK